MSQKEEEINKKEEDTNNSQTEDITDETEIGKNVENKTETNSEEQGLNEKYAELHDKFIRLYSDFDNFKKRSNKEKYELISTASSSILKELLPILDDFERAIKNNENVDDINSLKEGFHLIYNKFKSTLESKGLKEMESIGSHFDSEVHEAIANIPAPSEDLKGKVIDHVEKGYYLHDKVIRFAKVIVGQ